MSIQAAFTADVVVGSTPLTVNYTDKSPGSPTNWLWDFGDGYTSDEQHPTHIYETDGAYTVTLRAFISTGSSDVTRTLLDGRTRGSNPPNYHSTNAAAHDQLLANSWASISYPNNSPPRYTVSRRDDLGGFGYAQTERDISFDLSSFSSGIATFSAAFNNGAEVPESGIIFSSGKMLLARTPFSTLFFVEDVSSFIGGTFLTTAKDINDGLNILGTPPNFQVQGWIIIAPTVTVFTVTDQDTLEKINYIVSGPPIAAFSGAPLSGDSPLSVALTNESLGEITSYSWRKRKAGSGDAFVQFSTSQNPTKDFNKVYP